MISRNLLLDLDEAEPGMVLSATLFDSHGGVLLPTGVELTDSILTSLRRRGIDQVTVENDRISDADLAAERERVLGRLDRLFRICGGKGASDQLRDSILQYRVGESK